MSTLLEEYKKYVENRNVIQAEIASQYGMTVTPNTVSPNLSPYDDEGNLNAYGQFITTQLYQGITGNSEYDAYVANARSKGNNFMSLSEYKAYNKRQEETKKKKFENAQNENVSRETSESVVDNIVNNVSNVSDGSSELGQFAIFAVVGLFLLRIVKGVFN